MSIEKKKNLSFEERQGLPTFTFLHTEYYYQSRIADTNFVFLYHIF